MGNKSGFAQFVEHFGLKPGQEQAERAEKVEDVPARTGGSSGWAQFKKAYGLSAPSSMAGTPPAGSITTPEEQEKMRQDAVAQVGAFAGELVSNASKVSAENKPMLDYQEYLKQTGQEVDTSKLVKGSAEYNAFLDGFYRWQGDKYLADASASTEKKQSLYGEHKNRLMDEIKIAQQSGDPAAIMDAVKRYKAQYDTDSAALDQNYTDNKMSYWANRMNFSDFESKGKYAPKVQSFYDEDSYYKNYLSMPEAERKPIWEQEVSFADALYESVNGNYLMFIKLNNDERLFKDPLRQKLKWDRNSATSSTLHLDAEERQIFNYIFETEGVDKAIEFLNDMHDTLDARYDQYFIKKQQEWAKEDPFGNSLATVVSSPFRAALGAVGTVADLIGDGELEKDAWYSQLNRDVAVTRGAIGDQIRDSWAGNVGGFLYDAGMSMGDSVMNTVTMGGFGLTGKAAQFGSSILSGSNAAVTTMDDALARGLSSGQALTLGLISGVGEATAEKISLGTILDKKVLSGSALKQMFKSAGVEGLEEVSTELLNTVADVIISQDKSHWQMAIDAYKEQGLDENAAFWRAVGDKALELGYNFAAGAASGGMMSGGNLLMNAGQVLENRKDRKALGKKMDIGLTSGQLSTEQIQSMIDEGLAFGKGTDTYTLANRLQNQLKSGKTISGNQLAQLMIQSYTDAASMDDGPAGITMPQIDTDKTASAPPTANPAPSPAPIDMDELIDSSIASIHNAPADPLRAAMEGFKTTGTVTNSQARDILNNTRAVQQLIQQTGIQLPDTASGRRAAVKQAVAHLAQQQNPSPIDTAQNTDYDNQNTTGGMNHAEGLHQNDRAGSSGDSAQGMAGIQSGDGSGVEGWGQHGQVAVDPGIFRVSDELSAAQQKRGTPVYAVQDTSATPERYEQSLIAGRNSDTTNGWCVTPKSAQELQEGNVRTFMNEGGTVGVGIASNGDIVAVFKNKDGGPPKALDTIMPIAIEQGGDRLDCYGEGLVRVYARYGFIPVARVEFNAEYANEGWTPDKGTPYIYFMMHNGDSAANVAENIGKYPKYTKEQLEALPTYGKDDYDAAMAYRDSLMEKKSQGHPPTSVGAAPADFTGKSAFNDLLSDENAQPDRPDDVRPMEIPKTDAYGRHVSETAANIYGSEITPDHAADMVQELVAEGALGFDTKTNAQLLSQAAEEIKEDGLGASKGKVKDAVSKGAHKDTDIAKAVMLYTLYANKNTDTSQEEAAELMVNLCTMANDAGRKLQLFKLIRRMTPAGQLLSVEKGINRAVERINGRRSKKNQASVQIPQSLKNEYLAAAAKDMELKTTESAKAKEEAEQAMYKIAASQIKGSPMEKLNAWRYMSMLGNVKTQLRNIGGNLAFRSMVNAKRALGSVLESITLDKEKRTKSILGVGPKSQALLKWAKEDANTQTARNMLSYCAQTGDTARNAIEDNRQIYDHQWLENVRKFVQAVPEAADMVFKNWEYSVSLASFMKARGYTVDDLSAGTVPDHILNEGRSYAAQEALKATFNDLNTFSAMLTKLRYNGDNSFMKAISALGEGVMPFRRTPANIAARAVEYSPIGLTKTVFFDTAKLCKGEISGAQFIDRISAGTTGTAAAALGWLLASGLLGIRLRGRVDDEDEKNAGHQSYSIEIGGKSYTVDWLAPTNIPFFMGANFYETGQATDADWFSTFLQSSVGTFEPMLELSCLSSVNDLLETVQYSQGEPWWAIATSAATSYLNQYLPTLFGQIEQATESEKKTPYSDASTPFGRTVERFIGKATQKIPIIDLFQAEKYDSHGNPEKTTGWGEALLSPSYASEISDDPVDQEIARLNQAQSTNVSFPSPPKTLSYTDSSGTYHEDYRLSASEYETMGRVQGQTQYRLLSQLMKSEDYAALSDKEKATAVESVYKYAKEKAAIETFPDHAGFSSAWMSGVEEQGADVILHKTVENSFTGAFSALTESWSSGWADDAALTELEDAYTTFSALPDNTRTDIKNALTGRCTAYVAARESGMSTDTFSELYRQYRQISDSDLSPSAKAQKWAHVLEQSVERHQISTSQRDLMKGELGFAAIISQDSEGYDKMLAAGVSSDSADLISDILRDILPEDGHSSIRPIQKLEAIAESDELTDEELERILPLYMSSDSTRQRYDMALDKGFSSEEFVVAYRIYLDKDGETKTQLIRQMANELDIPYALARQLYEIHSQRLSNE